MFEGDKETTLESLVREHQAKGFVEQADHFCLSVEEYKEYLAQLKAPLSCSISYKDSLYNYIARNPSKFGGTCYGLTGPISPIEVTYNQATQSFSLEFKVVRPDGEVHQEAKIEINEEIVRFMARALTTD